MTRNCQRPTTIVAHKNKGKASTAICSPSSSTALLLTQSHELENSLDKSNDEHAQKVFSEDAEAVQMANNIMQRLKDDDEVKGQLFRNAELDASTILSLLSNLVQESAPMKQIWPTEIKTCAAARQIVMHWRQE